MHDYAYVPYLKWKIKNFVPEDNKEYFPTLGCGWIGGQFYGTYGPLLVGCPIIVYEGGVLDTPDKFTIFRLIEKYKPQIFLTLPAQIRMLIKSDPERKEFKKFDTSSVKSILYGGEKSDNIVVDFLNLYFPSINNRINFVYGQTECGTATGNYQREHFSYPIRNGSNSKAFPGFNFKILDDDNNELKSNKMGKICLKAPLPPCNPFIYLENHLIKKYFTDNYYETSDNGYLDEEGYVYISSRINDEIKVDNARLNLEAIESILVGFPNVIEACVIAKKMN